VLARARATIGAAATAVPLLEDARLQRRGLAFALAAAAALAIGVAGAVVSLRVRAAHGPSATPSSVPSNQQLVPLSERPVPAVPEQPEPTPTPLAPQRSASAEVSRRSAPASAIQESYAAELDLLHRAQVGYASGDFATALLLLSEHARRFPNGRLAEEREALRVRSLSGSGRTLEAQRAAAAFAARFPRSVLLPRTAAAGAGE
jgi:hypothetical protein